MRRRVVTFLVMTAVALTVGLGGAFQGAWAQAYPSKLIKIIVPFPPGNTMDIQSRLIAPTLIERLGKTVVVENRPGAAGVLGMNLVAKSPPDGYTIAAAQGGNLCVLPHTSKGVFYDPRKDFAPIAFTTANYQVIYAGLGQPFKTLPEMIAYAKAQPGKLTVAHSGTGGFSHLAFEHLARMAGFTYNHVAYKGASEVQTGVLGGEVQVGIGGSAGVMAPLRSGKLNLLAVTSKNRVTSFPDKPAAAEFVPGYEAPGWFGFVAPAGTPHEIVNRLNAEINRAMALPEVVEKMVALEMVVITESPKYFEELIKNDYEKYGKLVRDIGFVPQ
jgi:tripartite-type tricarboxylate transporter receptor subunit TctC